MFPSADPYGRLWRRAAGAGVVALALVTWPSPAYSLPAGSTTRVLPVETPIITFAGGTAELDGSTTLETTRTGTKSRIDCTILFAKDSDHLRPGAGVKLGRLATQLQRQGPGRIQVTGYTDDLGSAAHGLDLSRRRAQRVATALGETLPDKTYPMRVRGRGEADPAVPNTTETNRRKNRRVTVILTVTATRPTTTKVQTPSTTQPNPTPTAATALPTAEPNAPSAEPSGTPAPAQPTTQANPGPTPIRIDPQPSSWPITAGVGLVLVVLGGIVDHLRRRRGPPSRPLLAGGPMPKPTDPENAKSAARVSDLEQETISAAPPMPTVTSGPSSTLSEAAADQLTPVTVTSRTPVSTPDQSPGSKATNLDQDLEAWFSGDTHRPRLSLLGPVQARTHGQALARRKPYYTELLAYLTLKTHGATVDEIADTFGLTTARVRTDMKVLRDWLGTDPSTHEPYLPDARTSAAALQRGLPTYQVRNVLCDYHLFTQLTTRATAAPQAATSDLETALRLVAGQPFSHTRTNGWHWLFEGDRLDLQVGATIVKISSSEGHCHTRDGDAGPASPKARASA